MKKVYLDYAATTPVDPEVVRYMRPFFSKIFANTQSLHKMGQESSKIVEDARRYIANTINCEPEEIIFTSGGTESNNLAIKGIFFKNVHKKIHIISTKIEHHSVLEPIKFLEEKFKENIAITLVPTDEYGLVDIDSLFNSIRDETTLISIMFANNEIGTIQPIKEIGDRIKELNRKRKNKIYFHSDAVQVVGHKNIDVENLGLDMLSFSGHKFYAPKGVGVLFVKKGIELDALLHGGGHEFYLRSGTVNHTGIAGLYKALEISNSLMDEESKRIKNLRDKLYYGITKRVSDVILNGSLENRLENNLNLSFYGIEAEALQFELDNKGIEVSTGSACSSVSGETSHVLLAIGRDVITSRSAIRFSLGRFTSENDIDYVLQVLPKIVDRLRKISPLIAKNKIYN